MKPHATTTSTLCISSLFRLLPLIIIDFGGDQTPPSSSSLIANHKNNHVNNKMAAFASPPQFLERLRPPPPMIAASLIVRIPKDFHLVRTDNQHHMHYFTQWDRTIVVFQVDGTQIHLLPEASPDSPNDIMFRAAADTQSERVIREFESLQRSCATIPSDCRPVEKAIIRARDHINRRYMLNIRLVVSAEPSPTNTHEGDGNREHVESTHQWTLDFSRVDPCFVRRALKVNFTGRNHDLQYNIALELAQTDFDEFRYRLAQVRQKDGRLAVGSRATAILRKTTRSKAPNTVHPRQ